MRKLLTRTCKTMLYALGVGIFGVAQAAPVPVAVTGYTADVVADGTGAATARTTLDFDGASYALMTVGYTNPAGATSTSGLPATGLVSSANTSGLTFQLAAYTANNSLRIATPASGTLTLTAPRIASDVYVLASSGSGISTATVTVTFSDGTTQVFPATTVGDWYNGAGAAIIGLGRVSTVDNTITNSTVDPRLYEFRFSLAAANYSKLVQSVSFNKTSTTGVLNVMGISVNPLCNSAPTAGTATATATNTCASAGIVVSLTGASADGGVAYQWQSSTNGGTTYTDIAGATGTTYAVAGQTVTTLYRARLTCSSTSQSATSTAVTISSTPPTYATLPFIESFESTWLDGCNTRDVPSASWRNTPATGNPSWRRDDDGAAAAWTSPTAGGYTPVSSQGTHSSRFHTYFASSGTFGNLDLYVNLSAAGAKRLSFDFINTSGSDSLLVQLSTDGGTTFARLVGYNLNATFTTQILPISATSATSVLRFRAKSDFGLTDIGLDNIVLESATGCLTPVALAATTTATTASLTWLTGGTGTYTVLYGPTGFNPAQASSTTNFYTTVSGLTAPPYTITALTALTGYQFYVIQNCGGTSGSTRSNAGSFTTNPTPTANDECTTALPLTVTAACTTPVSGTVYGATQSLAPTTNCGGTIASDVWYSFVATATALQLTTGAQFTGYYDLRSGACASTTSVSCGLLGTTTTPLQTAINGLTTGQTYFLRIYSTSIPTATASSFTLCLTPVLNYCNTGLGGSCGSNDITAVSIATTTFNATGLTCTTTNGQAYTSYPATGANTATLLSGTPYQLSVTVGAGSIASVWIDYNHNLVFEAGEWTQLTTSSVGTAPVTVIINLPTNSVQGPTGMRIRTRSAGSPNGAGDACTQFFSGETKDFTITIGVPVTCPTASNMAVSAITSTTASLAFTPSASATTYTLTLTPQNGTATTRSVTASPVSLTALLPNTTYTLTLVSNCSGSTTSPAVTITFTTLPTNDECTAAVAVAVGTTCTPTNGTVLGATQSLAPTTNCGVGITSANDVWYSFVATSNSHIITFAPQFAAAYDVRSGTCASTTSLYCTTVAATAANNNTIAGLTIGQTYFIRVYASLTQPTGPASTFTLCIVPGPATPANDDCAGAINVPIQFGTCVGQTSADNTAATSSTGAPAPACASYQGRDIWFKVTVPASGAVTVQTLAPTGGSAITDTGLSMYSGTCGTLTDIGCNDDTNGFYSQLVFTGRTPGEVLYIRVWAFGGLYTGPIAVCAISPSNCAVPTDPSAGTLTSTSAVLNWVAPTSGPTTGNTYEIEYGLQNFVLGSGTTVTGLNTTSRSVTGLLPNTAYCFYVRQNCGTANGSSAYVGPTCFTTPQTIPLNDEPCGAVGLGAVTLAGSTVGANTSSQPGITTPVCSPAGQPKDVWFAFTAAGPSATFTLTGSAAGMLRVYASPNCSAGPFAMVGCASSGANNTGFTAPILIAGLTAGTRYYVAVSGYGSADAGGVFTLAASGIVTAARALADTNALLVYPNPSSTGQLALKTSGLAGTSQATLLNALGQVVLAKALTGATEQTLNTRGLAAGVYTLRVAAGTEVLTRKVVLE